MRTAQPSTDNFSLATYLPLDRQRALAQGFDLPSQATGSVLFADLSGFTSLMEHLANTLGPQRGAEELTLLLNALFTPLIDEVHDHGGSIVAFGGDALTCWFPGELAGAAPRAAACALAMQDHILEFGPVETAAGPIHFSMHVGIASGKLRRFLVGRSPYGLRDVLAGAAMDRMAEAQHRAGQGEVVVDAATAAALPGTILRPLEGGFGHLPAVSPLTVEARDDSLDALPPLAPSQIRRWLAEPLYLRLSSSGSTFAAELRLVCSMFVQFAGLDYDRDPGVEEKLQRYVTLAQERLALYEGYLSLVACGDKGSLLHVLFGAPTAHEDDPARAVGFALEFQQAVRNLGFIQDQRIGISVGRVYAGVLGSPQRCTYTVLGDEVNLSARLMQAAQEGQVLVSQRLQRAAGDDYTFQYLGAVEVKGREKAVPIYSPQKISTSRTGEIGVAGNLVGRGAEQERIKALLDEVGSGQGHMLQIVGEAGVGKSALLGELLRRAQGHGWQVLVGTCLSYGQSTPYLPWRAILEKICGLTADPAAQARLTGLVQVVAGLPEPPGRPGYWQARLPLLGEVLGLTLEDTSLTQSLEGELRRDNTFQILEALVRHQAAERPAVVVLEDAHWADELSLALVGHIAHNVTPIPLLLILVHRPFGEPIPQAARALAALPRQSTLEITALEQEDALELARRRLQVEALPPPLENLLIQRTQGNPFFVEELLRALQEGGHLQRKGDAVELIGTGEGIELPDTIEGVVRARIDRLPEAERLTIKVATVIGRTFHRPLLEAVHPGQPTSFALDRQLTRLGKADFTQLEEAAPEWRYAFRHPILHEVTYTTLLYTQRRQLHGVIGAALERWYAADLTQVLDLLAYHYARSEEREKAVCYLQQAAEKARREYANEVALGYYSQALERLRPEERELRYDLLAGRERIYALLGEGTAQEQDLDKMGWLAHDLGDLNRQVQVLNRKARREADMGAFQQARGYAQEAWERSRTLQADTGAAEAQKTLGIVHASLGEYDQALAAFVQSQKIFEKLGHRLGQASCLANLGTVQLYQGEVEHAQVHYKQALELARVAQDRWQETQLWINLGFCEFQRGTYDQALQYLRQALTISQEIGSSASEGMALHNIAELEICLGSLEDAYTHYEQALHLSRQLGDREGEAYCMTGLGPLLTYQGEVSRARDLVQTALEQYRDMGHRRGEANALHARGIIEFWAGEISAVEFFQQAMALRQELGEQGNTLCTEAWLALALLIADKPAAAQDYISQTVERMAAEEYSGDYPEQEIWWAAYHIWQNLREDQKAQQALEKAHRLVQEQAGLIRDVGLRRSLLERVPVNREIVRAWERR